MMTATYQGSEIQKVSIRLARARDAGRISALCLQLGYQASQAEVEQRLRRIQQEDEHAVYVAETSGEYVVGWVHVFMYHLLESPTEAEVGGLVVDENCRRWGAGRLLMRRAEEWAREKGCWAVHLRSNIIRKDAHGFYADLGYHNYKTQLAFRKVL
jgi:GNAT superfamily N-acetyltransferase